MHLKNHQIPNFVKIRAVEAQLFHARRQIDMTKRTVFFRHFASARKRCVGLRIICVVCCTIC